MVTVVCTNRLYTTADPTIKCYNFYSIILFVCNDISFLLAECSIARRNISHVENLQPSNLTGYFYYPISCNGTLVAINAHGFCQKTNRRSRVLLVFFIVHIQDNTPIGLKRHNIEAKCDTSTATSVNGLEYYNGTISTENQTIKVSSDEYLAIRFKSTCNNLNCFFQPAIISEVSNHTLFFTKNISTGEQQTNISLLFSATIRRGM